jgi:hypothetical protein
MTMLGEAYAFGVVWSFFMKALGVLVLRYQRTIRSTKFRSTSGSAAWRFPSAWAHHAGARVRRHRQSVLQADRDQIRRRVHHGVVRHVHHFGAINLRKRTGRKKGLEQFNLDPSGADRRPSSLHARPGCVLVAVRDYIAWSI